MQAEHNFPAMEPIYDEETNLSFTLREGNLNNKPQFIKFLHAFVRKDIAFIEEFVAKKSHEEIEEAIELLNHLVIQSPICANRPRNIHARTSFVAHVAPHSPKHSKL